MSPQTTRPRSATAAALHRGLFLAPYGPLYYRGFVDRRADVAVRLTPPRPNARPAWPAYLSWSGAAALLIASAVTGGLALDARADWRGTQLQGPAMQARLRYDRMRYSFFGSLGGAVGLGALGALLFDWGAK